MHVFVAVKKANHPFKASFFLWVEQQMRKSTFVIFRSYILAAQDKKYCMDIQIRSQVAVCQSRRSVTRATPPIAPLLYGTSYLEPPKKVVCI
jgi:hypothetical protein